MGRKDRARIEVLEAVVEALLSLLHKKELVKRDEVQIELMTGGEDG